MRNRLQVVNVKFKEKLQYVNDLDNDLEIMQWSPLK